MELLMTRQTDLLPLRKTFATSRFRYCNNADPRHLWHPRWRIFSVRLAALSLLMQIATGLCTLDPAFGQATPFDRNPNNPMFYTPPTPTIPTPYVPQAPLGIPTTSYGPSTYTQ